MPEFINPNSYTVHLTDHDGKVIKINANTKLILPEYFDRYLVRGFIKRTSDVDKLPVQSQVVYPKQIRSKLQLNRTAIRKKNRPSSKQPIIQESQHTQRDLKDQNDQNNQNEARKKRRSEINRTRRIAKAAKIRKHTPQIRTTITDKMIVGRRLNTDATELFKNNLEKNNFPISNNIGVGILSYNRINSLKRIINSIIKNTDLRKTTIFISDDGSTDQLLLEFLNELDSNNNFVVLQNQKNIGVAGNSNRLIRCLSRFKYGIILNDDVEILMAGWEYLYPDVIEKTNMHHFLYRQVGVYGAKIGEHNNINGVSLYKVDDRPHGAVMAFSKEMITKCGYFNEDYGNYGMEHVDWSQRAWEFDLQPKGFFDVNGSDRFFRINTDESAVTDRVKKLQSAQEIFKQRVSTRNEPTDLSYIPEITYIVPFRNTERNNSIITVINNIRSQRFPIINIIIVEHDSETNIDLNDFVPVSYYFTQELINPLFNKAIAFNLGVLQSTTDKIILHDADMLTQGHYTKQIFKILDEAESCHLGGRVMYANQESTNMINQRKSVDHDVGCDRVVGYFEGGSIACIKKAYWKAGALNQDYWGYGCEDCDFYQRLSQSSKWVEDRCFDFLHLWHSRIAGWNKHHSINKSIESKLVKLSIQERINLQHRQLQNAGYAVEIAEALK